MSSHSYDSICPCCGEHMSSCSTNKPFDMTEHWCYYCGFTATIKIGRMTKEDLLDIAKDTFEGDTDYKNKVKKVIQTYHKYTLKDIQNSV